MDAEEGLARLRALGFGEGDAESLWEHFDEAEGRGKPSHGHARIPWLEELEGYDPEAAPVAEEEDSFWRYRANGTIGYLVLSTATHWCTREPPEHVRLVVCEQTFPTGMLAHYTRRLAQAGLVALLTTTSPRRLGHPEGGPRLASTSPLSIGIPSSGGDPVVVDVSMAAAATWGDVVAGLAKEEDVVPFGGPQAHKAFALAVGLQLFVDALLVEDGFGAVLLVARPESDPVPALRELAAGVRLPGG